MGWGKSIAISSLLLSRCCNGFVSHSLSALEPQFHTMGILQILTTIIDSSDMRPNSWSCENLRAHESLDVLVCYIRSHEGPSGAESGCGEMSGGEMRRRRDGRLETT